MMLEGHAKKIGTWNKRYPAKKLSRWLLVIDELADVMLQQKLKTKLEPTLVRIAQLGRAVGIHMVLATQTPKTEVITQLIQNNIPTRIAFRCSTGIASGTMLDGKYDAARLPEIKGRALLRIGGKTIELQTPFISDMSIKEVVDAVKSGEYTTVPTRTVAPDIIFKYALTDLNGDCAYRDLHKRFKSDGVTQKEITEILKDYEVRGAPPCLEPEIEIDDELYYLTPSPVGVKRPRTLVKVYDFERDFETKWANLLPQASGIQKTPETVAIREPEFSENFNTEQVLEEVF
jgi:DNA segregation ATPase FtsK/SpoIIIE-like protein